MATVLFKATDYDAVMCRHCKSVIAYRDEDIRYWTDSDGPGGCGSQYERIDCPNCNRSIDLD